MTLKISVKLKNQYLVIFILSPEHGQISVNRNSALNYTMACIIHRQRVIFFVYFYMHAFLISVKYCHEKFYRWKFNTFYSKI